VTQETLGGGARARRPTAVIAWRAVQEAEDPPSRGGLVRRPPSPARSSALALGMPPARRKTASPSSDDRQRDVGQRRERSPLAPDGALPAARRATDARVPGSRGAAAMRFSASRPECPRRKRLDAQEHHQPAVLLGGERFRPRRHGVRKSTRFRWSLVRFPRGRDRRGPATCPKPVFTPVDGRRPAASALVDDCPRRGRPASARRDRPGPSSSGTVAARDGVAHGEPPRRRRTRFAHDSRLGHLSQELDGRSDARCRVEAPLFRRVRRARATSPRGNFACTPPQTRPPGPCGRTATMRRTKVLARRRRGPSPRPRRSGPSRGSVILLDLRACP